MNDTYMTVCGNLASDPELRYTTQTNTPVVSFTVLSTPRNMDRTTQTYKDGETLSIRCSAWRQMAENVNSSLKKGSRVVVYGRITQHSYEDQQGNRRYRLELTVEDVGASLRLASAEITRNVSQNVYNDSSNQSRSADPYTSAGRSELAGVAPTDYSAGRGDNPFANPLPNPFETPSGPSDVGNPLPNPFVDDSSAN
jgi:single-strand DNA-binding protein